MNEENRHEELQALKRDILSSLHCALPGRVVSFDAESQTAVIQPAVKHRPVSSRPRMQSIRVGSSRPENSPVESFQQRTGGSPGEIFLPLLRDVPVFMPVSFEVDKTD